MKFREVFDQVMAIWASTAGAVFLLVTGVMLVAVVRNRAHRRHGLAFHADKNKKLELGYVAVLAAIVGALVTGSFVANGRLDGGEGPVTTAAAAPGARIDVTAYRWCWDIAYRGTRVGVTGECRAGRYPTLVVPAGQPVEFDLRSKDVIHAFWLPDFAVKRDIFPDHVNRLRMTFPHEGRWRGRCSEYCGTHHWTMDFYVQAVSPEKYGQYLAGGGAPV